MQTLILLCTLAALAGLPFGYWIGWAVDEVTPYVRVAIGLVLALWGMHRIVSQTDALRSWCWDVGLRAEPFFDTEPVA